VVTRHRRRKDHVLSYKTKKKNRKLKKVRESMRIAAFAMDTVAEVVDKLA